MAQQTCLSHACDRAAADGMCVITAILLLAGLPFSPPEGHGNRQLSELSDRESAPA
jgi:hypothetical protein